jgi:hypothetical protein
MRRKVRAPAMPENPKLRIGRSFRRLAKYRKDYIIKTPDGKPVSLAEAARNYQKDGDPKWPLHVFMLNLGYFAIGVSRALTKFGYDPDEYIEAAFQGICNAMKRCNPDRVKLSYLATGVYFSVTTAADKNRRKMKGEVDILKVDEDGELIDDDKLAAMFGIFLDDYE